MAALEEIGETEEIGKAVTRAPARTATPMGFWDGAWALVPFWPGTALFGVVYAVAARAAGLSPREILGMSLLVHAGSAQFAATGLIGSGAGTLAVMLATAITNARYALMAASVAPHVAGKPRWWRLLYAWQLSDESYAMTMTRFLAGDGTAPYAYGANVSVAMSWLGGGAVGVLLGSAVPAAWRSSINLVEPLIFLALLVPLLRTRRALVVALVAGTLAVLGAATLPGASYLLLAGIGGTLLGILLETKRVEPRRREGREGNSPQRHKENRN